jgi:nucleotide-binding universal stress UspA family protein
MKMLVCTDGSEQSQKALEKAALFAESSIIEKVTVIHVYDGKMDVAAAGWGSRDYIVTTEDMERLKKMYEDLKLQRQQLLDEAVAFLATKKISADTILAEGHPSHTIVETAHEGGYDFIVIGSRGLGGLKKLFLGSVSNAVIQEANNCCVMVVR